MKNTNPKAIVDVKIDNELQYPKINVVYSMCNVIFLSVVNDRKSELIPTNMSFKQILHTIQDELLVVNQEIEKKHFDAFRKQEQNYILSEIKMWDEKHKDMIKELKQN